MIIITGAASGIGLATAKRLKERGEALFLWDKDEVGLAAVAEELNAPYRVLDVTDTSAVQAAFKTAAAQAPTRAVIHSAGILHAGEFATMDIATVRRIIDVNLFGTVNVSQAAIPYLVQTRGSLILLGSVAAFYGAPDEAVYGATKAAILSLAQALRIELEGTGIHIGVCNPLFVNSPMLTVENVHNARVMHSGSPFMRIYEADEVAAVLVRALETRPFMIWVGLRPRLIWWVSRYGAFLAGRTMANAFRAGARRRK